jgi:anti-sigma regulatory factor (Ser/Thr protein kinase)
MRTHVQASTTPAPARRDAGFAIRIKAGPTAACEARQAALACFDGLLSPDKLDDVLLVVSELVTNAVLHGRGDIDVRMGCDGRIVTGAVSDEGRGFDRRPRRADSRRVGGHGLHIVGRVSEQWGLGEGATSVWFEIALRDRPVSRL